MPADVDLRHHGDAEVGPGLVDLAVNVRPGTPPAWLAALLRDSVAGLAAYPDAARARAAVARRHGRSPEEVLLTAGAAEAFVLLARVLTPRRAVVVHPQFTEPEAALRAAGHTPDRVLLTGDFRLPPAPEDGRAPEGRAIAEGTAVPGGGAVLAGGVGPEGTVVSEGGAVPEDADLVMLGNPTNPTSVLHPAAAIAALARPGRTLVVDEAFMDCVPGETESLASRTDVPGLVVIRSLTKTWGLAGLRVGYVLAEPPLIARLAEAQPLWSVSTPALVAAEACTSARAVAEADAWARDLAVERDRLAAAIRALGPHVVPGARASFLCLRVPPEPGGLAVRAALRDRGYAVRRGDTFPGLGPDWLRVAVRDASTDDAFTAALKTMLT
ncbi:aminotransferase class I/II-fold pyridoxal phosphate-dependent enzyme [Actinoallomurus spadix]|uniref:Aminotransferase n=1 Tax=Actinoallomurus spadix TaxID=79912 RepID=A0ABP3HJ79_9ACTN|nr:aminotransferase class I/II-fold pyridoxal phosphate-dependent enzyme [Actinoallomurus spadix]MCO5991096.1 aminotransferase class I/II-fold pyridoxal phosphate-dependent enzyme [Actinoallomurus spadix]